MEELFNKMSEYVKMTEELPLSEFHAYYQSVIDYLMKNYQDMSADDLVKAKGITMIMAGNAKTRARRKDENRKKYDKIAEKAEFWESAIKLRLTKDGLSAAELDEKVEALWA
ncbi:MAG: hypothetical protein GX572_00245 [Clostridia bacterium]|nr:hypothetical protein [Clostridia bacterium]